MPVRSWSRNSGSLLQKVATHSSYINEGYYISELSNQEEGQAIHLKGAHRQKLVHQINIAIKDHLPHTKGAKFSPSHQRF